VSYLSDDGLLLSRTCCM